MILTAVGTPSFSHRNSSLSSSISVPGLCTLPLPVNASCPHPSVADACKPDFFCFVESRSFQFGEIRKCRPRPRLGQACNPDNYCRCTSPFACNKYKEKFRAPLNVLKDGRVISKVIADLTKLYSVISPVVCASQS